MSGLFERIRSEWAFSGARGRDAERALVWMLGSPRTGSTWLLNLLAAHPRVVKIDEPGIGYHLGMFAADVMGPHPVSFDESRILFPAGRSDDAQYFFAKPYERVWRPRLRELILARLHAQLRKSTGRKGIESPIGVIKEPAGSQAAEFLFSILPASRLLFLVRDPRDVLDSELDAVQSGSWLADQFSSGDELSGKERADFLRAQAYRWLARTESVQRAYDALPESQRYMVRYEDLRSDTAAALRDMLEWLELRVEEDQLRRTVELLSFEALPDAQRGKGKFTRSATPGMWRENLRPDELAMIHTLLGDAIGTYGYEAG